MAQPPRSPARQGAVYGLMAGAVLALAELVLAAASGAGALAPFRFAASLLLGGGALEEVALAWAVLAGLPVHLLLSAAFGALYALWNAALFEETRASGSRQLLLGLVFGAALYAVNFQVLARMAFPWFHEPSQLAQLLLHALFFGAPMGLFLASAERRAHGTQPTGEARSQTA